MVELPTLVKDSIDGDACYYINGKKVFTLTKDPKEDPQPVQDIDGDCILYKNGKAVFGRK